jgi:hypothetical protein
MVYSGAAAMTRVVPEGEGEPDVLLTRCSYKSLRDLSPLQSGENTLKIMYIGRVESLIELLCF